MLSKAAKDPYSISSFYHFAPLSQDEINTIANDLRAVGQEFELGGMVLLAPEGINGTIFAQNDDRNLVCRFKEMLQSYEPFQAIRFKDSYAQLPPFRRFTVSLRRQIVTMGAKTFVPIHEDASYLTPEAFDARLKGSEPVTLLDTRNHYETAIGRFEGATDLGLSTFSEFPEAIRRRGLPKDRPVLMYCTGGIRCEKAASIMRQQGYKEVYQLKDGILNYLEHIQNGRFEGECFVFDRRCAVTHDLRPSERFGLCPHCGDPGDREIQCACCGTPSRVCSTCLRRPKGTFCSRTCWARATQPKKQKPPPPWSAKPAVPNKT